MRPSRAVPPSSNQAYHAYLGAHDPANSPLPVPRNTRDETRSFAFQRPEGMESIFTFTNPTGRSPSSAAEHHHPPELPRSALGSESVLQPELESLSFLEKLSKTLGLGWRQKKDKALDYLDLSPAHRTEEGLSHYSRHQSSLSRATQPRASISEVRMRPSASSARPLPSISEAGPRPSISFASPSLPQGPFAMPAHVGVGAVHAPRSVDSHQLMPNAGGMPAHLHVISNIPDAHIFSDPATPQISGPHWHPANSSSSSSLSVERADRLQTFHDSVAPFSSTRPELPGQTANFSLAGMQGISDPLIHHSSSTLGSSVPDVDPEEYLELMKNEAFKHYHDHQNAKAAEKKCPGSVRDRNLLVDPSQCRNCRRNRGLIMHAHHQMGLRNQESEIQGGGLLYERARSSQPNLLNI
ncbi:hypothetical protein FA13DRAFT_1802481 [Coprinellus micaceus]|uniref:Uncharacterized protein n=1 Tax=Coprinellus micaceus TaxID=71717 RepID=A0A4Y7SE77_COPMI|nr:hypothetical protein FA13DRAFT_1802481 [Coprinellus micaceus]